MGASRASTFAAMVAAAVAAAVALLAVGGCHATESFENPGPPPNMAIATDRTDYAAQRIDGALHRYRFTVISRFQNRTATPLYLGRCFPNSPQPLFGVQLASPGTTESGYEQVWGCVGHEAQFAVLPGATRTDTLVIEGPNAFPSGSLIGRGVTSGLFRLYYDVRLAPGDGAPQAPSSWSQSNAFVVSTVGL
jgi:hypothetical protein